MEQRLITEIANALFAQPGLIAKDMTKEHLVKILSNAKQTPTKKVELDNPKSSVYPPYGWSGSKWNDFQAIRETLKEGEYLNIDTLVKTKKAPEKHVDNEKRLFSKDKDCLKIVVDWINKNDNYEEAMSDMEDPKELSKRILSILAKIN
jgi:hypothetical protein